MTQLRLLAVALSYGLACLFTVAARADDTLVKPSGQRWTGHQMSATTFKTCYELSLQIERGDTIQHIGSCSAELGSARSSVESAVTVYAHLKELGPTKVEHVTFSTNYALVDWDVNRNPGQAILVNDGMAWHVLASNKGRINYNEALARGVPSTTLYTFNRVDARLTPISPENTPAH